MLIDARTRPSTAVSTVTLPPPSVSADAATVMHSAVSVRDLVNEVSMLVADLGLGDGARWVKASAAVAATAATLRSAVIDLTVATQPRAAAESTDAVPVGLTAAPVVRAREIGFLSSRLTAVLDDLPKRDQIHATINSVGNRLERDLQVLRRASDVDVASAPAVRAPLASGGGHAPSPTTGTGHADGSPPSRATIGRG